MTRSTLSSPDPARARGSLLGLALGDALGAIVEFKEAGSFTPVTGFRQSETWPIPVGAFTDDTSQALCLAHSLIECGFDPADQLRRYVDWYRNGYMSATENCFDIGLGTRQAIERFERDGYAQPGEHLPHTGGAGALMRMAPLVIWCGATRDLEGRVQLATLTTHGDPAALEAAQQLALLLRHLLLSPPQTDPEVLKEELNELVAAPGPSENLETDGSAVHCLASALWSIQQSSSFEQAVLAAVNLGGDSDTRAAITGQLAGALYGAAAIPAVWREQLLRHELIEETAERLIS